MCIAILMEILLTFIPHRHEAEKFTSWTNEMNFAVDGKFLMTPQSHLDFLARASYQLMTHSMRQLPLSMRFDAEKYLSSIIVNHPDYDEPLRPTPWPLASDGSPWVEPLPDTGNISLSPEHYYRH